MKSIAGTNLTAWFRGEFPEVGIVYIVRHPFATATSVTCLAEQHHGDFQSLTCGAVDDLVEHSGLLDGPLESRADQIRATWRDAQDPFDRSVLRWCLENAATLQAVPAGVQVVFYERLFGRVSTELPALAAHLRIPLGRDAIELVAAPSWSDRRTSNADRRIEARVGDWVRDLAAARMDAGLAILEAFGLDAFYGEGPFPLCSDLP